MIVDSRDGDRAELHSGGGITVCHTANVEVKRADGSVSIAITLPHAKAEVLRQIAQRVELQHSTQPKPKRVSLFMIISWISARH